MPAIQETAQVDNQLYDFDTAETDKNFFQQRFIHFSGSPGCADKRCEIRYTQRD